MRLEHQAIRELQNQLLLTPPDVRRRHADRLEALLLALDPTQTYPYEFVFYRITGFRPSEDSRQVFTGEQLRRDLHVLLESLSESAPAGPPSGGERLYSLEEAAGLLKVTVRTVHRWRRRGLVARWYRRPDGRAHLAIRQRALDRFVELYGAQLRLPGRVSRLSNEEGRRAVAAVRRLRSEGRLSLTEAVARAAESLGRSPESVRQAVARAREDAPDDELLAVRPTRLARPARGELWELHRQGVPAGELAQRFGRSRASVYRVINQERARALLGLDVAHVPDAAFAAADARESALGAAWRALRDRLEGVPPPTGAPAPLSGRDETDLLRAHNYTSYLLAQGVARLNPRRYVSGRLLDELEELARQRDRIRELILRLYLPVVERVARQHSDDPEKLAELCRLGRGCLLETLGRFDYGSRARLPSYLTLDLQKRFARAGLRGGGLR